MLRYSRDKEKARMKTGSLHQRSEEEVNLNRKGARRSIVWLKPRSPWLWHNVREILQGVSCYTRSVLPTKLIPPIWWIQLLSVIYLKRSITPLNIGKRLKSRSTSSSTSMVSQRRTCRNLPLQIRGSETPAKQKPSTLISSNKCETLKPMNEKSPIYSNYHS